MSAGHIRARSCGPGCGLMGSVCLGGELDAVSVAGWLRWSIRLRNGLDVDDFRMAWILREVDVDLQPLVTLAHRVLLARRLDHVEVLHQLLQGRDLAIRLDLHRRPDLYPVAEHL